MLYPNGIEAYREEKRKEAIDRHNQVLKLEKERQEREAAAAAEKALTEPQAMAALAEQGLQKITELQPGNIYAVGKLKSAVCDIFTILQYLLKTQQEPGAAEKTAEQVDGSGIQEEIQQAAGKEIAEKEDTNNDDVQRDDKMPKRPGRPRKTPLPEKKA